MTDRDFGPFMEVVEKIRVKSVQKLLMLFYNSRTMLAYLPKKHGGWGLKWEKEQYGERPTTNSLRKLVEKTFGNEYAQRISQRALLDYAYALQALQMVPP